MVKKPVQVFPPFCLCSVHCPCSSRPSPCTKKAMFCITFLLTPLREMRLVGVSHPPGFCGFSFLCPRIVFFASYQDWSSPFAPSGPGSGFFLYDFLFYAFLRYILLPSPGPFFGDPSSTIISMVTPSVFRSHAFLLSPPLRSERSSLAEGDRHALSSSFFVTLPFFPPVQVPFGLVFFPLSLSSS